MTIKTQNELYEGYKLSIPQMVKQFNIKSFETLKFETAEVRFISEEQAKKWATKKIMKDLNGRKVSDFVDIFMKRLLKDCQNKHSKVQECDEITQDAHKVASELSREIKKDFLALFVVQI